MTRRIRYPRGLTRDAKGWRVTVGIGGGKIKRQRFPPTLTLDEAKGKLDEAQTKWKAGRRGTHAGTLDADITRYLRDYCTGRPHHDERQRHLKLWLAQLGKDEHGDDRLRADITKDDVSRVLHDWRLTLEPETCNKRRTALLALYHALDGKGASNPVRDVPKFRVPAPLPRGLPYPKIRKALALVPKGKTKLRLTVLAYTGIRAGQLMRLTPDAYDARNHALLVPGTEKGRGTKPYVLPLSARAEEALKAFAKAEAWGTFTYAPMARMWKTAAMKAGLSASVVPYDLRHSFATAIYRATGDIQATRTLLGHSSLRVTERYMLAAVPMRSRAAIRAFARAGG